MFYICRKKHLTYLPGDKIDQPTWDALFEASGNSRKTMREYWVSESTQEKRRLAGHIGGTTTTSKYNMKEIGALGGKAAQARGTAHKLTKEEKARGGSNSRRK